MKNLKFPKIIFPIISMMQTLSMPFLFIYILYCIYIDKPQMILVYLIVRYIVRLAESIIYIFNEQRMDYAEKIFTLVFIVPLELLFSIIILPIIKYISLFYLKDKNWSTR